MSAPIHTQLREYTELFEEEMAAQSSTQRLTSFPQTHLAYRRGPLLAVAVAVAIAVLATPMLLMATRSGNAVPATNPSDTSVPTTVGSESDAGEFGNTAVYVPGLSFAFEEGRADAQFDKFNQPEAIWFDGGLHVLTFGAELFRLEADDRWVFVGAAPRPSYSAEGPEEDVRSQAVITDGSQIVSVRSRLGAPHSSADLACNEDTVATVGVSSDGVSWSRTDLVDVSPFPDLTSLTAGQQARRDGESFLCRVFTGGGEAIGAAGILVMRLVSENSYQKHFPHVWWSDDGDKWVHTPMPRQVREGPNVDKAWGDPIAVEDGFLVLADPDIGSSVNDVEVWHTEDGTTWTLRGVYPPMDRLDVWNGEVVAVGPGVTVLDTGQAVLPPEATTGVDIVISDFGLAGISTADEQWQGVRDIVYSRDGSTWSRWALDDMSPPGLTETTVEILGIGDGFIALGRWYEHTWWVAETP